MLALFNDLSVTYVRLLARASTIPMISSQKRTKVTRNNGDVMYYYHLKLRDASQDTPCGIMVQNYDTVS